MPDHTRPNGNPSMNLSLRSFNGIQPRFGKRVYIDPSATLIGDVELGDDASVWPGAVVRGDVQHIHIGAHTNVQDGAILHATHDGPYSSGGRSLEVGAGVTIGHGAVLHACCVGDTCLIGIHAVLLDGVVVEPTAMIGAAALIPPGRIVGRGELWLGNPARCVRKLNASEIEQLAYSAAHYVRLKNRYLDAGQGVATPSETTELPRCSE